MSSVDVANVALAQEKAGVKGMARRAVDIVVPRVKAFVSPQLLVAFLIFGLSIWWNTVIQVLMDVWTRDRLYQFAVYDTPGAVPEGRFWPLVLPDLGFYLFEQNNTETRWADIVATVFTIGTMGYFCIMHGARATIMRRFVLIQALLFFLRGISISVTLLPQSRDLCEYQPPANDFWSIVSFTVQTLTGQVHTCTDMLFSGHTTNLTCMLMVWLWYTPKTTRLPWLFYAAAWALQIAGMWIIVATRFHYSIDVFIAFVLTIILWVGYGLLVQSVDNMKAASDRAWYLRFVAWMECAKFELAAPNAAKDLDEAFFSKNAEEAAALLDAEVCESDSSVASIV